MVKNAAIIYASLVTFVICFQIALIFGAPWGEYAMGGFHHGTYDLKLKYAALGQIFLLSIMACIVLIRADLLPVAPMAAAKRAMWFVLIMGFVSMILNIITPSIKEKIIWAPVAIIMFVCAMIVARNED